MIPSSDVPTMLSWPGSTADRTSVYASYGIARSSVLLPPASIFRTTFQPHQVGACAEFRPTVNSSVTKRLQVRVEPLRAAATGGSAELDSIGT